MPQAPRGLDAKQRTSLPRYDALGRLREEIGMDGGVTRYRYDVRDQVLEATPPVALQANDTNPEGLPVERYRYDRVHNRLESDHQPGTWIYNANNELQSYGTGVERRVLSYDANGSTIREERGDPAFSVTEYVYDPQDRLIEVKRDGMTQVEYAYDPFGQRIWRETKPASVEGVSVTWFLYSREGLIGEYRADGSVVREYGWLPNGLWGTDPVWQHDVTGTHVMHNDHLFTPERMTRAGESVVSWAGNREAFGRVAVQPGSSTTMLLRFPGQWEDGVGGFHQNWWREYGAGVGRYRSVDPIGIIGGINFHLYSMNRPLNNFDQTGLISPGGVLFAGVVAGCVWRAAPVLVEGAHCTLEKYLNGTPLPQCAKGCIPDYCNLYGECFRGGVKGGLYSLAGIIALEGGSVPVSLSGFAFGSAMLFFDEWLEERVKELSICKWIKVLGPGNIGAPPQRHILD